MLMKKEREEIVSYGKKMLTDGYTTGTGGNLSIYDASTGYMAISPSGIPYFDTQPQDVVILDLEGNVIEGEKKPSSEHYLHAVLYKTKSDARAVVHMHSMFCTTLACLNKPLEAVHQCLADAGATTVPVVPYYTFGTKELGDGVAKFIGKSNAALMANHGMIACGGSLSKAYSLAATCEWVAEIQWRCMCAGKPAILSSEDMEKVIDQFKGYGQ